MSDVEWTNELVVRLMREYRKRPELWDGAHDLYRVHTAKYEAWAELAGLFECDIVDLRKKLNSIFASHRREKAKVRCGGRSTWFLYPHMSFLPTHVENDETTAASERRRRILQLPEAAEEPARCSAEEEEEEAEAEARGVVVKSEAGAGLPKVRRGVRYAAGRPPRPPRRARLAKRRGAKEKHDEDDRNRLAEMMRLLRRSDSFKKKDECDSFGEYIADSLRKHDERTQSMIKQAINNILFEQEMKRCGGGHYAAAAAAAGGGNPLAAPDLA